MMGFWSILLSKLTSMQLNNPNVKVVNIKPFSRNEIEKAIGIILLIGIHKLPNQSMYWANLSKVLVISEAMTRNRFEDIL